MALPDNNLMNQLSRERTHLANERTMLAHIRTAFASFLFGIAVFRLFENTDWAIWVGILGIAFGFVFLLFGIVYYPVRDKRIKKY